MLCTMKKSLLKVNQCFYDYLYYLLKRHLKTIFCVSLMFVVFSPKMGQILNIQRVAHHRPN